ncbi:radical SAM protein [Paludibacter sp. 221]|uniref:B12-binding domain-containing radical SAM protein n=1 Tax=Paludibacter sp. 221 TaxID=2302939 RepID=UPI0013CF843D|nr:radical SAM protein [Paludibacter sp. 221]NDV47429.1 radical SAM protein [Paludibacter sp. 221]
MDITSNNITFLIPPAIDGNPPAERTSGCTRVVYATPNIYELTVAAVLEEKGYKNIQYKDFVYDKGTREDLINFLKKDKSLIYYIWTVNLSLENDLLVLELIRQYSPGTFVVFLGPGATFYTKKCLKSEWDIVVRGEPDLTVGELTDALSNNSDWSSIEGISFLKDGKIVNNKPRALIKDLDTLPFPARHFVKDKTYRNPKLKVTPYTTMVTSRNCPYKCIYCVPSSLTFAREIEYRNENNKKPPISFRSVESVGEELKLLHEQGYKAIGFMDDEFIWNEKRTLPICELLKKYDFKWGCQARVDAITENTAKALGESGCLYVDLGVESFNDEILKYIKKGITSEQIYESIRLLKKYKVPVKLNILIGTSPLETRETLKDTLRKAKKLKVDQIMFNIVSPFPGTEFYQMAKDNGWIETPTGDYIPTDVQRTSILSYPHLSAKEMEKILYRSNLQYFFSPYFIFSQMKRFKSWKEFTYALKVLKNKLFG